MEQTLSSLTPVRLRNVRQAAGEVRLVPGFVSPLCDGSHGSPAASFSIRTPPEPEAHHERPEGGAAPSERHAGLAPESRHAVAAAAAGQNGQGGALGGRDEQGEAGGPTSGASRSRCGSSPAWPRHWPRPSISQPSIRPRGRRARGRGGSSRRCPPRPPPARAAGGSSPSSPSPSGRLVTVLRNLPLTGNLAAHPAA